MEEPQARRLAAILHADIVDSTRLVQQDESAAHACIRDLFDRFSEEIARYNGIARELRGDALVAEFDRASDAVCAAVSFQANHRLGDELSGNDMHPQLRVGIALGEVVVADGTLTGTGVILAQRLEQMAEGGGITVQGAARETIPNRLPFVFDNLGEQRVKGFDQPVRAFSATLAPGAQLLAPEPPAAHRPMRSRRAVFVAAAMGLLALGGGSLLWSIYLGRETADTVANEASRAVAARPSVGVLPFENLSADPEQAYFADGLADDLITDLSKVPGLTVTARNSSFAYRGMPGGVRQVAQDLGVRYLLDGSVRRAGTQIRINAQLIDATTERHVWSERYDRRLEDVFAIQDEVTRHIVSALQVNLGSAGDSPGPRRRAANFDAYDVLLRALEVQARFTPEDNAEGRALFEKAARLDPAYARAHAGIAFTHAIDVNMNWTEDREHSISMGEASVRRALELDDELPRAYFAWGSLLLAQRRHAEAIDAMQRAVELAPNYADGHAQLAFALVNAGRHEEGLGAIQVAKRLNPLYSQLYMYVEAMALFHLERFQEAAETLQRAIERNPAFDRAHVLLAATYGQLGSLDDATWTLEEASVFTPGISLADERRDSVLGEPRDLERFIDGLRAAGLTE